MIRINLLPYREERRKAQRRHFGVLIGMVALLGGAVVLLVYGVIAGNIAAQEGRNDFLKKENAKLDKDIEEIKKLKEEIQALLARKQIIDTLQAERAQAVHLLDELVRQTPDGVYLKALKQDGLKVNVTGYAFSDTRVAVFMNQINAAQNFEKAQLIETKAAIVAGKRLSEFNLNFWMKRPVTEEAQKAGPASKGGTPAAKKG